MARPENRDLIGLPYPVTADPMTCDGSNGSQRISTPRSVGKNPMAQRIRSRSTGSTEPGLSRDNGIRFAENRREPQSAAATASPRDSDHRASSKIRWRAPGDRPKRRDRDLPISRLDSGSAVQGGVFYYLFPPLWAVPNERTTMPTKKQTAAWRSLAAKARSGKGKVGKAAKSSASPRKKR